VVGIAGPSGSGKTTLARALAGRTGGVVFALDAYYRDQHAIAEADIQVDIPEAIDVALAVSQLRTLVTGTSIAQPVYDFATHSRLESTRLVEPAPLLLVEGLFAFFWEDLRDVMHTRVFVALDHDECLRRRMARDLRERGRTRDEVIAQYEQNVRPMYERHVAATQSHAHVVLDGRADIETMTVRVLGAIEPPAAGGSKGER
jgi:uridine kinase